MSSKDAILDGMRSALSEGYPVIIVLETSEEFTALTGPLDEQLYVETKHSQFELTGLHAMTVVGYDDDKKYFIVENSWGIEWGDKGYFALPYDATNDIYELWTVTEFNIRGSLIK